jgi:putative transposase
VLSQVIKLVPRHVFGKLAAEHHKGTRLRSTSRWDQFIAMAMGQLGGRASLRDIESNLRVQSSSLYHVGAKEIARSSLARLNQEQPYQLYEGLFYHLYARCRELAPKHGFRFKNPLFSIDSSLIDLSLSLFPWSKLALGKGAMKLHVALDHRGLIPAFAVITDGKDGDVASARPWKPPSGSIVVIDRGYCDYDWLKSLDAQGNFFVIRERQRQAYQVIERRPVDRSRGLLADQLVTFTGHRARSTGLPDLRRVSYRDPITAKHYSFLTNHHRLSACTIAAIYKDRWQIELFFRWIKQNLKIKTFLGRSKNAILTQLWITLCLHLVLSYLKFSSKIGKSLQQMLRLLSLNLFQRCSLSALFAQPAHDPPPASLQTELAFA